MPVTAMAAMASDAASARVPMSFFIEILCPVLGSVLKHPRHPRITLGSDADAHDPRAPSAKERDVGGRARERCAPDQLPARMPEGTGAGAAALAGVAAVVPHVGAGDRPSAQQHAPVPAAPEHEALAAPGDAHVEKAAPGERGVEQL